MTPTNISPDALPPQDAPLSASHAPLAEPQIQCGSHTPSDAPSVAGTVAVVDRILDSADDIGEDVYARLCPHCGVVLIRGYQDACEKCRDTIIPKALPQSRPCTRCKRQLVCLPDTLCFDCKERDLRRSRGESAAAMRRSQAPPASPTPTGENGQV